MQVLFVTHTVAMAGANSSMLRLMQELRDDYGVVPVVLMPQVHPAYAKRNLLKTCQEQHIECYSYRFYWFKEQRNWKTCLACISNLLWYPRILWKMRGKKYDIIHSNGSVISLGALISRVKRTPHVWHLREFGDLDIGLHSLLGRGYERWLYKNGDVFIAISNVVKDHFSRLIPPEKIRMIYNGIAVPNKGMTAQHNNAVVQFCMIGLVSESKNQRNALAAVDILVNKYRITNFHLSFVGLEEHPYVEELLAFVSTHGLNKYVKFMGERNDVNELLCDMDVGLMLSRNEAFGRVTVEYMMHGLAVIASDTGANLEIVADAECGLIFPSGDCEALALKMRSLIENHDKLQSLAMKGRDRAKRLFTSDRNTRQIYDVYESLVSF